MKFCISLILKWIWSITRHLHQRDQSKHNHRNIQRGQGNHRNPGWSPRSCANGSRSTEARPPCVARVARLLSTLLARLPCSRLQTHPTYTRSHRRPIYEWLGSGDPRAMWILLPKELSQAEKRRNRMTLLVEELPVDVAASAAQSRQSEQLRQCSSGPMPVPSSLHGGRGGRIRSGSTSRS